MKKIFYLVALCLISFQTVSAQSQNEAIILFNEAIGHFKNKDFKKAIASYSQAIEVNPDYTKAYYNRGNAKLNIKDFDGAIDDFLFVMGESVIKILRTTMRP